MSSRLGPCLPVCGSSPAWHTAHSALARVGGPLQAVAAVDVEKLGDLLELLEQHLHHRLVVRLQLAARHVRCRRGHGLLLEPVDPRVARLKAALRLGVDLIALGLGHAAERLVQNVRRMALAQHRLHRADLFQAAERVRHEGRLPLSAR